MGQESARQQSPAQRLRTAPPAARPHVFREVYESHLRHVLSERPRTPAALQLGANYKIARYLRQTAGKGKLILEIGCGFGATALHVGRDQSELAGVDAAPIAVDVAARFAAERPNLRFSVMDATRLDFPDSRFDLAYSVDLIEHLHPDDVPTHLREVHRVLRVGGAYVIKTPSELTGPHDAADPDDPGRLHLREYRYGTLLPLLRQAGFGRLYAPAFSMRIACWLPGRSRYPASCNLLAEAVALLAPARGAVRARLARALGVKQVVVVAEKGKN